MTQIIVKHVEEYNDQVQVKSNIYFLEYLVETVKVNYIQVHKNIYIEGGVLPAGPNEVLGRELDK